MSSAQPLFSSLDRYLPSLLRLDNGTNSRYLWVGVVLALGVIIELGLRGGGRTLRLPTLNTSSTTWTYKEAKNNFVGNAKILLAEGLKKFNGPFMLVTDLGPKVIVPPAYVEILDKYDALSLMQATANEFHSHLPGFDAFRPHRDGVFEDAVRVKLTRSLPKFTGILSEEMTVAMKEQWPQDGEWHAIPLKTNIAPLIARLSARIFVGPTLCRNKDWLRITVNYTIESFQAAQALRLWPSILRPIAHRFLAGSRKTHQSMQEARDLLKPVIKEREAARATAVAHGEKDLPVGEAEEYNDALTWFEALSRGDPYDAAAAQMGLALSAIHTTTDLLTQALYEFAQRPDLVQELRDEAVAVLKENGWRKQSLYEMKLMDSVLKETQRMKPTQLMANRLATSDITLPDGTFLPRGTSIAISANGNWDPLIFPDPETFDPYRFLRMRNTPGQEHKAHLVSTSANVLGFSHGKHACPGRFFAANEIKIALVHLLLGYEWGLVEGRVPRVYEVGAMLVSDPMVEIAIRRRKAEIEL